jgi:hypothetical protein
MPKAQNAVQHCPACGGGGLLAAGNQVTPCPYCGGQGQVPAHEGFPVPFFYPFNVTFNPSTVSSGSATKQISNEADFQWVSIVGDTNPVTSLLRVLLEDLSSNFKFSSDPIDINNFMGTGQLPFTLVEPYTFGKNTQLRLTVSDNASGLVAPVSIQICLHGYLLVKDQGVGSQSPPAGSRVTQMVSAG